MNRLQCLSGFAAWAAFIVLITGLPSATVRANDSDIVESFAVEGNGDVLLVPVLVDGSQHLFILDTGASITVFDASLRRTLEPTRERLRINKTSVVDAYRCDGAIVGNSKLKTPNRVLCLDLVDFRAHLGHNIRGVLGMDFLKSHVVRIDFDACHVDFLRTSESICGSRIPMSSDHLGRPTVTIRLPAIGDVPFLLDSGHCSFSDGKLCSSTFDALHQQGQITDVKVGVALSIHGRYESREGKLAAFSLGQFRHVEQLFDEGFAGCDALGLEYLCRYTVTMDFPEQTLVLEKGKQYDRPFPDGGGIDLVVQAGEMVVLSIDQDGFGYKCGIRAGDQILAIEGRETARMSCYRVARALTASRDGLCVTVKSPGKGARDVILERRIGAGSSRKAR